MKTLLWIIVAVVVIGGGWYLLSMNQTSSPPTTQSSSTTDQPNMPATTNTAPATTPTTAPSTTGALNVSSNATLGNYLVAANDMTLYVDTNDKAGVSTCTGACAASWPPYTVNVAAALTGGSGITGAIGTIAGTMQLTYKGMPLYFWAKDTKPGDATGNNIGGFVVARP